MGNIFIRLIPLPVTLSKDSEAIISLFLNDSCLLLAESLFITQLSASLLVRYLSLVAAFIDFSHAEVISSGRLFINTKTTLLSFQESRLFSSLSELFFLMLTNQSGAELVAVQKRLIREGICGLLSAE